MRNHIHLVLETTAKGGSLSEVMKGINISYAQYYKKEYGHIGHFWQDRYKSILISKDNYLLACGTYVELNPVRARIVEDPRDYRWSSYAVYAYGGGDKITDAHPIYEDLSESEGERRKKYREFVKAMVKDKGVMKGEMDKRRAYGSEGFLKKVVQEYNIDVVIKSQGRPKKGNINNK
jgi:putative transposase